MRYHPRYRIFLTLLAGLAAVNVVQAHEKWFVADNPPALHASGFFSTFALSAAAVVVVVMLVAAFIWQKRGLRGA